jgi:hypothetical protein
MGPGDCWVGDRRLTFRLCKTAAWDSTPAIKRKLKGLNFPKEIKDLITEKCKLRRKWHQSTNPHDKTLLNRASQQLSKEIENNKRQ